jgi:hypothetical protein
VAPCAWLPGARASWGRVRSHRRQRPARRREDDGGQSPVAALRSQRPGGRRPVLRFIDQGYIAPWTSPANRQNEIVTEAVGAAAGRLATGGYTVVYDGVIGPWFLETFTTATQLPFLHYAILLPPEPACPERVRSRADHGFRDQRAARHMYRQFATADVDPRYLVTSTDAAVVLARQLFDLVHEGRLRWPAHDAQIRARQPSDP